MKDLSFVRRRLFSSRGLFLGGFVFMFISVSLMSFMNCSILLSIRLCVGYQASQDTERLVSGDHMGLQEE